MCQAWGNKKSKPRPSPCPYGAYHQVDESDINQIVILINTKMALFSVWHGFQCFKTFIHLVYCNSLR